MVPLAGVIPGATRLGRLGRQGAAACAKASSFDGATPVLMADGTSKPIRGVREGDVVLAADPKTGKRTDMTDTLY